MLRLLFREFCRNARLIWRCYPSYLLGKGWARVPSKVNIDLTYRCNAHCKMCPLHGEHVNNVPQAKATWNELTTEEFRRVIRQCAQMGVPAITFSGGEPLLRRDIVELVAEAEACGINAGIISNGSLLDEAYSGALMDAGLDRLHVSLDGPEETHDSIRGVDGMFTSVLANLRALLELKSRRGSRKPSITLGCTYSALNQDVLDELLPIAAGLGLPLTFSPVFYATASQMQATRELVDSEDIKCEDWILPDSILAVNAEKLADMFRKIRSRAVELGLDVDTWHTSRADLESWFHKPEFSPTDFCLYPWHTMRINPEGNVYPCSMLVNMGNVRETSLGDIWNGEPYRKFRLAVRKAGMFPQCAKCPAHRVIGRMSWLLPRFQA